jgi:hypothetical protein
MNAPAHRIARSSSDAADRSAPADQQLNLLLAWPGEDEAPRERPGFLYIRTRWGSVDAALRYDTARGVVAGNVVLHGVAPPITTIRLRLPPGRHIIFARIDGHAVKPGGPGRDTLTLPPGRAGCFGVMIRTAEAW